MPRLLGTPVSPMRTGCAPEGPRLGGRRFGRMSQRVERGPVDERDRALLAVVPGLVFDGEVHGPGQPLLERRGAILEARREIRTRERFSVPFGEPAVIGSNRQRLPLPAQNVTEDMRRNIGPVHARSMTRPRLEVEIAVQRV